MNFLTQLFRVLRHGGRQVAGAAQLKAANIWINAWTLIAFVLLIMIVDWGMKIAGWSWACGVVFFGVVLLTLFITPAPTLLAAAFGFGLFSGASGKRPIESGMDAVGGYLEHFVGNALLWTSVVAIVIWLLPIENNPKAFWIGLALLIVSELTIWKGWEISPQRGKRWFVGAVQVLFVLTLLSTFPPAWLRAMHLPVDLFHASQTAETRAELELSARKLADKRAAECMKKFKLKIDNGQELDPEEWDQVNACEAKARVNIPEPGSSVTNIINTTDIPTTVLGNVPLILGGGAALAGLVYLSRKGKANLSTAAGAASKTASPVTKSISSFLSTWTVPFLIVWVIASLINGSLIGPADVEQWWNKPATPAKPAFPEHFMSPKEAGSWKAYVVSPASHPLLGDLTRKTLSLEYGARNGKRPRFDDKLEGGYNKPLIIEFDENDPSRDIVLKDTVCNKPQTFADGKMHSTCNGSWTSPTLGGGTYELVISAEERTAVLRSSDSSEVMRLTFMAD